MHEDRVFFFLLTFGAFLPFYLVSGQCGQHSVSSGHQKCDKTLDFENDTQARCFVKATTGSNARVSLSSDIAKHGICSLKWESFDAKNTSISYTLPFSITGSKFLRGGIKMWIYKKVSSLGRQMIVEFQDAGVELGAFSVQLGFRGWRAIWVAFSEFVKRSERKKRSISAVKFTLTHRDTIYVDLLQFEDRMSKQSRDKIVLPLTLTKKKNSETYHWSAQKPTDAALRGINSSMTSSLLHIESRLRNFYCDESKTTDMLNGSLLERWKSLNQSIDRANNKYDGLSFNLQKTVITGPPLFGRNSGYHNSRKFEHIMLEILFPLTVEFYLKSREKEMNTIISREASYLNSNNFALINQSIDRIIGTSKILKDKVFTHIQNLTRSSVKINYAEDALRFLNETRLKRICNLLDFVEDQGWADGSALGSLEKEMNRAFAGYMNSLFLLKDTLHKNNKTRLQNLVKTSKWYNEFGEVYQQHFEYRGTNADKMITVMLFRLMIVLIMPTDTNAEKKARQQDMEALKRWIDNALLINTAFGGVLKPDYTGFHHKGIYGSAYVPQALHTAALVQYLLEGTVFELADAAKRNLKEGLKTLRIMAVKYSTPSSIGGRFPDYSKAVLIKILPAFAYISVSNPGTLKSAPVKGIAIMKVTEDAKIFLRLFNTSYHKVTKYMESGEIKQEKAYMNSLGSLEIMEKVFEKAQLANMSAEPSPEGHWSKNFGALSIHRRKNWAVTVKGFNRFVWDFECSKNKSPPENPYGIFTSYGSMLIANSEAELKAHDVSTGWDWTRIPGATTMPLTLKETRLEERRNFSPLSSAGGVTIKGVEIHSNGVFGMDFVQPKYEFLYNHGHQNSTLYFKKSVFFYQNLLVCLGSNISLIRSRKIPQTTLFQDKLVRGSRNFHIKVDGLVKDSSAPFPSMTPSSQSGAEPHTILLDTKGNSYFIPSSSASSLKIHVQNQTSKTPSNKVSHGYYGTAWLEHSPGHEDYEYAVWVNTPTYNLTANESWIRQPHQHNKVTKIYEVLKKDCEAHVVKFCANLELRAVRHGPLFGYVIYEPNITLRDGPVERVDKKCLVMVDVTPEDMFLSISYPDLDFNSSEVFNTSGDVDKWEQLESTENEVRVTLTADVDKNISKTIVHGSPTEYAPNVRVVSSHSSSPKGNEIVFSNLKNGISVEVTLKWFEGDFKCGNRFI